MDCFASAGPAAASMGWASGSPAQAAGTHPQGSHPLGHRPSWSTAADASAMPQAYQAGVVMCSPYAPNGLDSTTAQLSTMPQATHLPQGAHLPQQPTSAGLPAAVAAPPGQGPSGDGPGGAQVGGPGMPAAAQNQYESSASQTAAATAASAGMQRQPSQTPTTIDGREFFRLAR